MTAHGDHLAHLMVSGQVDTIDIRRGMIVVDGSDEVIAFVAGILLSDDKVRATHLVLGHVPPTDDYRLTPVELIQAVDAERVCLCLEEGGWHNLVKYQTE